MLGGNANNGTNAGLAYVNSNNDVSNSNANYGSRTCLKEEETLLKKKDGGHRLLAKKRKTIMALVGKPKETCKSKAALNETVRQSV